MIFWLPNPKKKPTEAIAWMEKNLVHSYGKSDSERIRNMGVTPLTICPMFIGFSMSAGSSGHWILALCFLILLLVSMLNSFRILSYLDLFPQGSLEEVKRNLEASSGSVDEKRGEKSTMVEE